MKKILVPTDFSIQADYSLHVAAQLAKKHDCEIYLLHMLELPINEVDALNSRSELPEALFYLKLAKKRFENLTDKPFLKKVKINEIVKFHQAFDGIMDACKNLQIDLIIMGSHGVSGFREMFIGSNTEKVVRMSDIPVLVIKNYHKTFRVKNFVYASDFSDENKVSFKKAIKFAKLFNATLHLLIVNTPSKFITTDDADSTFHKFLKNSRFKNYTINVFNDYTIEKGILNFAHHIDAGLIGISTHGRKGIAHFFNGSVSEDLVNHAKRPVLTFKI